MSQMKIVLLPTTVTFFKLPHPSPVGHLKRLLPTRTLFYTNCTTRSRWSFWDFWASYILSLNNTQNSPRLAIYFSLVPTYFVFDAKSITFSQFKHFFKKTTFIFSILYNRDKINIMYLPTYFNIVLFIIYLALLYS